MKELGQNPYVYGTKLFSFSGKLYKTRTLSSLSEPEVVYVYLSQGSSLY